MTCVVVVLAGHELNATLAGIEFDQWGQRTNQPVIVCDSWVSGFEQAKDSGYKNALFVRSGTVFTDWKQWTALLSNYPHQGLIAHVIWRKDQQPCIDDQCWFADLSLFESQDLIMPEVTMCVPVRSQLNIHDDYTPLWLKPGSVTATYTTTHFGQGLLAKQLNNNRIVCNWSNVARGIKFFCYPDTDVNSKIQTAFKDYLNLAESQLWIFNNEPFSIKNSPTLVTPGSGLHWMFNLVQPQTATVHVVDISRTQVKFCQELWDHWDGNNYGAFCCDFVKRNQLKHYELDQANLTDIERLKLKNPVRLIQYINDGFARALAQHNIDNFPSLWQQAQQSKQLTVVNANLVQWILQRSELAAYLWTSNILEYKWTKLNTNIEDYNKFKKLT